MPEKKSRPKREKAYNYDANGKTMALYLFSEGVGSGVFVNPRDNKPYVILTPPTPPTHLETAMQANILYREVCKDGQRGAGNLLFHLDHRHYREPPQEDGVPSHQRVDNDALQKARREQAKKM